MKRLKATLGYVAAALTVAAAVLAPFLLFGLFTRGVAATGVRIDPVYTGGETACVVSKGAYRIVVNQPVVPRSPLAGSAPFVQLTWMPADALPARVSDEVDINGDGRADLRAEFEVPRDANAPLTVTVQPLSPLIRPMALTRGTTLSAAILRVRNSIVVRIPYVPE